MAPVFGAVTIKVTDSSGGSIASSEFSNLESEINKAYVAGGQAQLVEFLGAMASAQAVSAAATGVDYSSNKTIFVAGGTANLGLNPGNNSLSDVSKMFEGGIKGIPSIGTAVQTSGYIGLSLGKFPLPELGPIDLKRFTIFVNFMSYSFEKFSPYTIKNNAFGLHLQYKLIQPKSLGLGFMNWGGVDLTTGMDISSDKYNATGNLPEIKYSNLTFKPTGSIAIDNSAFVIPLEATTNIRLLYALSLIGGAGVDFISSSSELAVGTGGSVSATVSGTTYAVGSASVTGTEKNTGKSFNARGIAGLAINLVPLKNTNVLSLYVIGNAGIAGYSVRVGVQGAW